MTRPVARRRCTASSKRHVDQRACIRRHPQGSRPAAPRLARRCARKRGAVLNQGSCRRTMIEKSCPSVVAHRRIAAPAMEARPCRASNPQRGSIEPAPSPAFRPSRRWRPCLGPAAHPSSLVWFAGRRNPRLAVVPYLVTHSAVIPLVLLYPPIACTSHCVPRPYFLSPIASSELPFTVGFSSGPASAPNTHTQCGRRCWRACSLTRRHTPRKT